MPWSTPSIAQLREQNRDYIVGRLGVPLIGNSAGRVLADANAGNAHLALQYLDWLANQLLPDTAETVFLDKWANIFLVNADGSRGRKQATYATGTVAVAATIAGTLLPAASELDGPGQGAPSFETTAEITASTLASPVTVRALDAGAAGNLAPGTKLTLTAALPGIDGQSITVLALTGGADEESDDDLRGRVLARIRQPPMGGDGDDWVNWTLEVAGVTRAWVSPKEMGVGTVTVRFMCDVLRATSDPLTNGLPTADDIAAVTAFLQSVRPVTVKEFYVVAPVPQPIGGVITNLANDTPARRAAINASIATMLRQRAKPASALNGVPQPPVDIPAAWVSEAIFSATGGAAFDLVMADAVMANNGRMAVLGTFS